MKYFTLLSLCLMTTIIGHAQLADVSVEIYYSDDGTVEGYPAGFTTWRVYAVFESEEDVLSAVYATTESPELSIVTSTNQIWNTSNGAVTGDMINPTMFELDPLIEYDSYVTIGEHDENSTSVVVQATLDPSTTAITDAFGAASASQLNGDLFLQDGLWYSVMGSPEAVAGDDLKVLIAQITTDGDLMLCLNFQVFPMGNMGDLTVYNEYCETVLSPLSVSENESIRSVLMPNPMTHSTQLYIGNPDAKRCIIRDLKGQIIAEKQVNTSNMTIDRGDMSSGIYLLQIVNSNREVTESLRLVVE